MPAIGVHHTDTVDEDWDGPGAVSAMPNDKNVLTYCHAWYDPDGDREVKGTYSFPHHKTDGGPANLSACRNGLSRVDGSNVPEGDKDKVRNHLQAHLDDANNDDGGDSSTKNTLALPARPRGMRRAPVLNKQGDGWYSIGNRVRNEVGEVTADIYIYDEIGWFGTSAQSFINELRGLDATALIVHINSPGGDAWDGIAIYNALVGFDGRVDVIVDSMAASAASVIAMAGDTITMAQHSQMMIHDASGFCIGNAADMREMSELLGKQSDNIAGVYASRAGGEVADWRTVMEGEAWYTAQEAVDAGLADRVREPKQRATEPGANPENRWDLSVFAYAGRSHAPSPPMPPVRNSAGATQNTTKEGDVVSTLAEQVRQRLGITDAATTDEDIVKALDEALAEQADDGTEGTQGGGDQQPAGTDSGQGNGNSAEQPPAPTAPAAPAEPVAAKSSADPVAGLPEGMVAVDAALLEQYAANAALAKQMHDRQQATERQAVVENAINDGRVPPARRDFWNSYMERDPEGAKAYLDQIPKNSIPVAEVGHGQSPQNQVEDDGWFDSVPAPKHTQGA